MDDVMREFLSESGENLSALDQAIVELERNPSSQERLAEIFRTIHTVKGTCGFLGLSRLERVAHSAENVLGRMRDGDLAVTPDAISCVLRAVDTIKLILAGLEATEAEPPGDDSAVIQALDAYVGGPGESMSQAQGPEPLPVTVSEASRETVQESAEPRGPEPLPEPVGDGELAEAAGGAADGRGSVASQTLRVGVDILDRLMNMVGELVLTRNQLLQLAKAEEHSKYVDPIQHLNRVTSGPPGSGHEDPDAAHRQRVGKATAHGPRSVPEQREADRARDARRGDRAGPTDPPVDPGSAHPHDPELGRSRHREPRGSPRGWKASRRYHRPQRVPGGRPYHHRGRG